MTRILFSAILAMCLVCVLQASPVPDQDASHPDPLAQAGTAINSVIQEGQKTLNEIINSPIVKQATQDAVAVGKTIADGTEHLWQKGREFIEEAIKNTSQGQS